MQYYQQIHKNSTKRNQSNGDDNNSNIKNIVDIGCGSGLLTFYATTLLPHVTVYASDYSENFIASVIQKCYSLGLILNDTASTATSSSSSIQHQRVYPSVCDATQISTTIPHHSIDIAFMCFVLHLIPKRKEVLLDVKKILHPINGILVFTTWCPGDTTMHHTVLHNLLKAINPTLFTHNDDKTDNKQVQLAPGLNIYNTPLGTRDEVISICNDANYEIIYCNEHTSTQRIYEGVADYWYHIKGFAPFNFNKSQLIDDEVDRRALSYLASVFGRNSAFTISTASLICIVKPNNNLAE
jgi:ubiquinone/menaquinone biosynthesis C-methylase UbiE